MQCSDVREVADSFLSGQLLVETNHEIVRHLETCPDCREDLAHRRIFRDRLRGALERAEELRPRPGFAADLAAALRPQPGLSRRTLLRSWGAVAAGLAVTAIGGVWLRESRARAALSALALQAAGDHLNCAVTFNLSERPIPLAEAEQRYGGPYGALATFDLGAIDGTAQVVDRHACVYDGHRFGHIVFRHGGTLTSLLVTVGPSPAVPQIERAGSVGVVSLPAGRFVAFIVSTDELPRLLELADALVDPLSQRLA